MDRRSFVMGLMSIVAAGSGVLAASKADAGTVAPDSCALSDTAAVDVDTAERLDEAPVAYTQSPRSPHWHHRHRRHRRRRQVCRVHIDRWGRRVRRCHWVWV